MDRLIGVCQTKIFIFNLNTLETLDMFDTFDNINGIVAFSPGELISVLAFPYDSKGKVRIKNIKKFIEQYKQRSKETKKKKLKKAIDAATKAYLEENPNLSWDIKQNIFDIRQRNSVNDEYYGNVKDNILKYFAESKK